MEPAALDRATKKRMTEITSWVAYTRVTWAQAMRCVEVRNGEESDNPPPVEETMAEFARLRFMEARALIAARKDCEAEVKVQIESEDSALIAPPEATGAPATSEGYVDRGEGVPSSSNAPVM